MTSYNAPSYKAIFNNTDYNTQPTVTNASNTIFSGVDVFTNNDTFTKNLQINGQLTTTGTITATSNVVINSATAGTTAGGALNISSGGLMCNGTSYFKGVVSMPQPPIFTNTTAITYTSNQMGYTATGASPLTSGNIVSGTSYNVSNVIACSVGLWLFEIQIAYTASLVTNVIGAENVSSSNVNATISVNWLQTQTNITFSSTSLTRTVRFVGTIAVLGSGANIYPVFRLDNATGTYTFGTCSFKASRLA